MPWLDLKLHLYDKLCLVTNAPVYRQQNLRKNLKWFFYVKFVQLLDNIFLSVDYISGIELILQKPKWGYAIKKQIQNN